jgi:predicted HicB family RNase H-like nuclease
VTFRLPRPIQERFVAKARRDKLSLAEFIRRALRREIEGARKGADRNER